MTRGLSTAVGTAVQGERVLRTVAADLDFSTGPVRVVAGPRDITIGGNSFTAIYTLGGISEVEETPELQAAALTLQLAGVPRDAVNIAMTNRCQGRAGTIYEVVFDLVTEQPLADPFIMFRGRMDNMQVDLGETATVRVSMTNRLADWSRPRFRRYTDEEHRRRYPSDRGFRFVTATASKEIVWPAKGFQGDAGTGRPGGTSQALLG
jgi:hypothetical protein